MACLQSANRNVCYCVARYENFVVKFVSYVIKEFAHAYRVMDALGKFEEHSRT